MLGNLACAAAFDPPDAFKVRIPALLGQVEPVHVANNTGKQPATGGQAKYLILDKDASAHEAVRHFAAGEGIAFPDGGIPYLRASSLARHGKVIYVLTAFRADTPFVRLLLPCLQISRATTWIDSAQDEMRLVADTGHDMPASPENRPVPTATFTLAEHEPHPVLMRLESEVAIYPAIIYTGQIAFERYLEKQRFQAGMIFGATLAAAVIAMGSAIRKRSWDYGIYFLALLVLAVWQEVKISPSNLFESSELRRFSIPAPIFIYFLLNISALWRLLKRPVIAELVASSQDRQEDDSRILWFTRFILGFATPLNIIGLAITVGYSIFGTTPYSSYLQDVTDASSGVSATLLLLSVAINLKRELPGIKYMFSAQIMAFTGFAIYLLREYTRFLDDTVYGYVSAWTLPAEALFWAVALSSRLAYLNMKRKKNIEIVLRKEENRIREEIAASNAAKHLAFIELDNSYNLLRIAHDSLIFIIDGATHSFRGMASKIDIVIQNIIAKPTNEKYQQRARSLLNVLMQEAEDLSTASANALDRPTPLRRPDEFLSWHISMHETEWTSRNLEIVANINPNAKFCIVDGIAFSLVVRELLNNVTKHAISNSKVIIAMGIEQGFLIFEVQNATQIEQDRLDKLFLEKLQPAASTFNAEKSSGQGLYSLHRLLTSRGGRIKATLVAPDRISIAVTFAILSNESERESKS